MIIIGEDRWVDHGEFLEIFIHFPQTGNLDIILTPNYLKISQATYLYELFPSSSIDHRQSNITIPERGQIVVKLMKENLAEEWKHLHRTNTFNKKRLKEEALQFLEEETKNNLENISAIREENRKFTLKQQMTIESTNRQRIEDEKMEIKGKFMENLENGKSFKVIIEEENSENFDLAQHFSKGEKELANILNHQQALTMTSDVKKENSNSNREGEREKKNDLVDEITSVRNFQSIQTKFTRRPFPTPLRDTYVDQENKWLAAQMEGRKALTDLINDDEFSENEKNLNWLKSKAKFFIDNEDYQSAIGLYGHCIRIFPNEYSIYSNRSLCHYRVGNLMKCIEDCSKSLELLKPKVKSNENQRLKCHLRRGGAFMKLELFAEALGDYEVGKMIDRNSKEIERDCEKCRWMIEKGTIVQEEIISEVIDEKNEDNDKNKRKSNYRKEQRPPASKIKNVYAKAPRLKVKEKEPITNEETKCNNNKNYPHTKYYRSRIKSNHSLHPLKEVKEEEENPDDDDEEDEDSNDENDENLNYI